MDPLILLLIGMAIVIGCILAFRMHAFLALSLAGITVAMITPVQNLDGYAEYQYAKWDDNEEKKRDGQKVSKKVGWTRYEADEFKSFARKSGVERFAKELGGMAGKIAILIAMAAIIGKCLLDSGAADRIVRTALNIVGEKRAPLAFIGSGFALGIPVFFDTVFYLMIPLGKALRLRTGGNYTLYILTIVAGATMAHSLVPPTPGPLQVAADLNINLGLMIAGGIVVGLCTASVGYLWAVFANRRWEVPLRESTDTSLEELEQLVRKRDSELPPFWLSITPILLPVLLITADTIIGAIGKADVSGVSVPAALKATFDVLGNKNIALIIAAAIALAMLAWQKRASRRDLTTAVGAALASGGVIILITAAGGGFGGVLRQTGIGERIEQLVPTTGSLWILPVAFALTTFIRTAQGSATVAMITAAPILASFIGDGASLGFHPLYVALAIGCGSKPIAWMNDSGFWVICKMSGMSEAEGLKLVTPMSIIMGVTGLGVVVLGAWLLPLAAT